MTKAGEQPTITQADLAECSLCGGTCSVQVFDTDTVKGNLWLCSNDTLLGGDCTDGRAYMTEGAWQAEHATNGTKITPEDRKAYAALYLKDQGEPHGVRDLSVTAEIEMGLHDDWDGVQAFAAHRRMHESTPENNKAGGLWYRRWFRLATDTRTTSLAAQDGLVEALEYMLRVFDETNANDYEDVHLMVRQSAKISSIADCRNMLSAIKGDKS